MNAGKKLPGQGPAPSCAGHTSYPTSKSAKVKRVSMKNRLPGSKMKPSSHKQKGY